MLGRLGRLGGVQVRMPKLLLLDEPLAGLGEGLGLGLWCGWEDDGEVGGDGDGVQTGGPGRMWSPFWGS